MHIYSRPTNVFKYHYSRRRWPLVIEIIEEKAENHGFFVSTVNSASYVSNAIDTYIGTYGHSGCAALPLLPINK